MSDERTPDRDAAAPPPSEEPPAASEPSPRAAPDQPRSSGKRGGRGKRRRKRRSLDDHGHERAPFLLRLPDDPELNLVIEAFEQGNYAWVRVESERLAREAMRAEVRQAARELRRRLDPDPLVRILLAGALALLAFLVAWAYAAH